MFHVTKCTDFHPIFLLFTVNRLSPALRKYEAV